jgi:hypothetical protein
VIIEYCETCKRQVSEAEMRAGGTQIGDKFYCSKCASAAQAIAHVPVRPAPRRTSHPKIEPAAAHPHGATRPHPRKPQVEKGTNTPLILSAVCGLLLIAVGIFYALTPATSTTAKPKDEKPPAPAGTEKTTPVEPRRELPEKATARVLDKTTTSGMEDYKPKRAAAMLADILARYKDKPDLVFEYEADLNDFINGSYRGTPAYDEAKKLHAQIKLPVGKGSIIGEYWMGITGNKVEALQADKRFPDSPDQRRRFSKFEIPPNWSDDYGARVRGYVHPPASGNYVFWIASDDESELYLSTDDDPAKKVKIAFAPSHTAIRDYAKHAEQESKPVALEQNKRYYIEALYKEGPVIDHMSVGWKLPDGTLDRPISGKFLSPFEVPQP